MTCKYKKKCKIFDKESITCRGENIDYGYCGAYVRFEDKLGIRRKGRGG